MSHRHLLFIMGFCGLGFTAAQAQEKITYNDHVRPLLENKCFSCHNPDKKKGDLDLTSFAGTMTGGGSGAAVNAGDPEGSKLITTTKKAEEPFMPPEGAPLSPQEIEILTKWVNGGVLETSSSIAKKSAPKSNLALASSSTGKPEGPLPMPENVLLEPVVTAPRSDVVTALAGNPWSPLLAVSGLRQALVYDTNTKVLAGVYPYPEGYIRSLKFSQNGALLVAGGGRGGKFGNAVVWDVKTGKRVAEVGKEFDAVMCADISANQAMVAIGSPSKKVKCYSTATGEELYVIKKHTEWVLSVAFSPDGVLLASADRNGNVIVSEAASGGEFYLLESHKVACTSVAWRSDSNILASCGEDGKIFTYEMENGKVVKTWDAHPGGALSVSFTPDGTLVSAGRDGIVRLWDINGTKKGQSVKDADMVTKVAGLSDTKVVASGDWAGKVTLWSADQMRVLGTLSTNPPPLSQRIIESERRASELVAQVPVVDGEKKNAEAAVVAKEVQLAQARKASVEAAARRAKLDADIKGFPGVIATLQKALTDAQAKRAAQVEALKKHDSTLAQIKPLEAALAGLTAERAKLVAPEQAPEAAEQDKKIAAARAQLDPLKNAASAPPQPLTGFDAAVKMAQDQITAFNAAKPNLIKEFEGLKKVMETYPKAIADLEKQVGDTKANVVAVQKKLEELRSQIAVYEKLPTLLRAAQFNVGVLSEKERLEKMESDLVAYQEAIKEAEAAKIAASGRIEASKKTIAEATAALPALEAAAAKLVVAFPAVEKSLEPGLLQESQVAAQAAGHQKQIAQKEAELKALEQAKAARIAAAQKAVEEINKQLAALNKQLGEVNGKLAGPGKVAEGKKVVLVKATADLEGAKGPLETAAKTAAAVAAEIKVKEAAVTAARQAHAAAQKLAQTAKGAQTQVERDLAATQGTLVEREKQLALATQGGKAEVIAAAQKAVDELKGKLAAQGKALEEAKARWVAADQATLARKTEEGTVTTALDQSRKALVAAQAASTKATAEVEAKKKALAQAKAESEAADKAAAPLLGQQQNLQKQIQAQAAALTSKKAEPAAAEQEFAGKAQPIQSALAQVKAVLAPVEKQLADIRTKLDADRKVVEARRQELSRASIEVDGAKKRREDAQKMIESSTKEIAAKDASLAEMKGELAKLEPTLPGLREKVKQLTEQYLAMLPK